MLIQTTPHTFKGTKLNKQLLKNKQTIFSTQASTKTTHIHKHKTKPAEIQYAKLSLVY